MCVKKWKMGPEPILKFHAHNLFLSHQHFLPHGWMKLKNGLSTTGGEISIWLYFTSTSTTSDYFDTHVIHSLCCYGFRPIEFNLHCNWKNVFCQNKIIPSNYRNPFIMVTEQRQAIMCRRNGNFSEEKITTVFLCTMQESRDVTSLTLTLTFVCDDLDVSFYSQQNQLPFYT